ncbi:YoaK family protein [Lentilactobacillus otakiensis]|uniref:YoaK family protein n=1 Tax=Lentilactobacillus otakiensis TaxID=481720 RepID=UPI003D179551
MDTQPIEPIGPYERLLSGSLLVMAAGVLDSYTYMQDGGVFAGLQTGNLILTGLRIGRGNYGSIVQALVSLVMFAVGVAIIRVIQYHYPSERAVTRKRVTLVFEILVLIVVSLIAGRVSILVTTGLLALAAASQLQEFRRMKNAPFTPLMMTGNVRTLSESILDFIAQGDMKALKKAGDIMTIIGSFFIGALLNGYLIQYLHGQTILIAAVILLATILFAK